MRQDIQLMHTRKAIMLAVCAIALSSCSQEPSAVQEPIASPPEVKPAISEWKNIHAQRGHGYSKIAGNEGEHKQDVRFGRFAHAIGWNEYNGAPCNLVAAEVADSEFRGYLGATYYECGVDEMNVNEAGFEHGVSLSAASITRLAVCNASDETKYLKGIRIAGSVINEDGSLTDYPDISEAVVDECNNWSAEVTCPDNYFSNGIAVHSISIGADAKAIVGLQLICSRVAVESQ